MFWQREYIRENVSMTLNSTYRIDLPEHGILGALLIRIEGANITDHGIAANEWRVLDNITEISVMLNGATICKSIRGDMVQALAFYDNGVTAPDNWQQYGTSTQYGYFLLDFGRYLFDPEVALDLGKFKSVELRIKNDADVTTEFSTLTVSILAFYLRESPGAGPMGFMRTEEWRAWTTVRNATEYLKLPTEHPLRRIILQTRPNLDATNHITTGFDNLMDDLELSLDTGLVRVYKGGLDEILRSNLYEYRHLVVTGGAHYKSEDQGVETAVGRVLMSAHGAGPADGDVTGTIPMMGTPTTENTQYVESHEANSPMRIMWAGIGYHNTGVLRFDYSQDPNTWLDPLARAVVQLNVHSRDASSAADGTNRVILDRFVRV